MRRVRLVVPRILITSAVLSFATSVFGQEPGPSAMPQSEPAPAAQPAPAIPPGTPLPPWMSSEVIKATVDIGMDQAQQQQFRLAVGDYITKMNSMITQEMRRESVDKDRTIKRKNSALVKKLDEQVKGFLREDQWPKYLAYKDVLRSKLASGG
jgi:hypothetical protein